MAENNIRFNPLTQFIAIHFGHHHVTDYQRHILFCQYIHGYQTILCCQDTEIRFQFFLQIRINIRIVFNNQDRIIVGTVHNLIHFTGIQIGYAARQFCYGRGKHTRFIKVRFSFGQLDKKDGTFPRFTFHTDTSFMHTDKLMSQMQTNPRSGKMVGGKKLIENGRQVLRLDSFPIIFY